MIKFRKNHVLTVFVTATCAHSELEYPDFTSVRYTYANIYSIIIPHFCNTRFSAFGINVTKLTNDSQVILAEEPNSGRVKMFTR